MVRTKQVKKPRKSGKPESDEDGFEPPFITEPQRGLVPVPNTPFYATPDTPTSPFDCDRYPNSIYCGGVPWSFTPVGLEPAIVIDECNIGIELTPTLGFTVLPSFQFVYRDPSCREEDPEETIIPPTSSSFTPWEGSTKKGCLYAIIAARDWSSLSFVANYETGQTDVSISRNTYPDGNLTESITLVWGEVLGLDVRSDSFLNNRGHTITRYSAFVVCKAAPRSSLFKIGFDESSLFGKDSSPAGWEHTGRLVPYLPHAVDIINRLPGSYHEFSSLYFEYTINTDEYGAMQAPSYRILEVIPIWCGTNSKIVISPPPPPKAPKRCDCTMTCCPSTTQNDQLLRSLIQKVDKLSKIVGVDDYPISLPTSLISRDEGFLGNLIPNFNENVPSLTRFMAWYVGRFDEIMGQWEIPIEIKDSDPSKPGDQPVGVKLPNIAEAIAEMFTLCFQTNINSETLLNIGIRNLAEAAADKQQNFTTYKLLQSLTDWAGFKQKDLALKMPLLMTLNKTRYDEILKESEVDVGCVEFDEKFGLEADLMKLREAVAILQAQYKVKLNPSADLKAQILAQLLDTFRGVKKVNDSEDDDADFEQFINDVETGFINTPGANQTTNPYDKPFNKRPKIRDLTKYEPPTTP